MFSINCPCCHGILFSSETNVHGQILKIPKLEFGGKDKPFMKCPHCLKQVDFVISAPPGGQGILLTLAQL